MRSIHPVLLVMGILLFLLVNRVYAIILPDRFYFSFSAFLLDNRDLAKLPALVVRLSQPFLVSFVAMLALRRLASVQSSALGRAGSFDRLSTDQAALTLAFAAGFTALLLAWPYILLWDILIDPALAPYRVLYLVAYLAYVVGVGFFALSGAETARVLWSTAETSRFSISALRDAEALRPVYNALSGSLATAVATFLATRAG